MDSDAAFLKYVSYLFCTNNRLDLGSHTENTEKHEWCIRTVRFLSIHQLFSFLWFVILGIYIFPLCLHPKFRPLSSNIIQYFKFLTMSVCLQGLSSARYKPIRYIPPPKVPQRVQRTNNSNYYTLSICDIPCFIKIIYSILKLICCFEFNT